MSVNSIINEQQGKGNGVRGTKKKSVAKDGKKKIGEKSEINRENGNLRILRIKITDGIAQIEGKKDEKCIFFFLKKYEIRDKDKSNA